MFVWGWVGRWLVVIFVCLVSVCYCGCCRVIGWVGLFVVVIGVCLWLIWFGFAFVWFVVWYCLFDGGLFVLFVVFDLFLVWCLLTDCGCCLVGGLSLGLGWLFVGVFCLYCLYLIDLFLCFVVVLWLGVVCFVFVDVLCVGFW